jgi:hypothetical protein
MNVRLDETLRAPAFTPAGDKRAAYETHGTSFLTYLARRAAKTQILVPLATLLARGRPGGPETAAALACLAYYAAAASTTYGTGYRQPSFVDEEEAHERDRETGVDITAINLGKGREIAAEIRALIPRVGMYTSRERVLGTTIGLRGLGMPAPSTFTFAVSSEGRRAGLVEWSASARGTIVTELAPLLNRSRIRAYGGLDLSGSDGSRGSATLTRDGACEIRIIDVNGNAIHLRAPLK